MQSLLPFLSLVLITSAATLPKGQDEVYDYIIVGGGTAGLVLAHRLSVDPKTTVAVIEAGGSVLDNPNVTDVADFSKGRGTSIDWQYPMQPQQYADDRAPTYNQGKALGGSSTINGATYIRPEAAQIDAFELLGNHGWNWANLLPYYKKSERLQPPDHGLIEFGAAYIPDAHGFSGHVDVGWNNYSIVLTGDAHEIINQTWQALGIPYNPDQSDGHSRGFSVYPNTIDSVRDIRYDSARSYYWSVAGSRKNLHAFTDTLAERIIWDDESSTTTELCAGGVQIKCASGGDSRVLRATREVILSAGSFKSPVILENSGVGNPMILENHDIDVKIDLPGVGENLQDQAIILIAASSKTNWTGFSPFVTFVNAPDLFGGNTTNVESYVASQIPAYASRIAAQSNGGYTKALVEEQLRIQSDLIFNGRIPIVEETFFFNTPDTIDAIYWGLVPFSRGNVHINSTDAASDPLINPNFFMFDWDVMVAAAASDLVREALHTAPLSDVVVAETTPNTTVVPKNATPEQWAPYFKEIFGINYHPLGTCAMMSRSRGGVVSPELMVYGTSNVRVMDASVIPFQINGHTTSTLYAMAERAADIILGKIH